MPLASSSSSYPVLGVSGHHRYSRSRIHMRVNQPAIGGRQAEKRRWTNTAAVASFLRDATGGERQDQAGFGDATPLLEKPYVGGDGDRVSPGQGGEGGSHLEPDRPAVGQRTGDAAKVGEAGTEAAGGAFAVERHVDRRIEPGPPEVTQGTGERLGLRDPHGGGGDRRLVLDLLDAVQGQGRARVAVWLISPARHRGLCVF